MGAFMLSSRERKSVLDPRTKLLLILTITSVVIGGGNGGFMNVVKPALTAVPLILFLLERKWKSAFLYTVIYTAAFLGELFLIPNVQGFLNFILVAGCGIFSRFMPGIAMEIYLVNTTTVSEFMAAMGRMHISQKIAIPLSVMFRFFPTVGEEYSAIGDCADVSILMHTWGNDAPDFSDDGNFFFYLVFTGGTGTKRRPYHAVNRHSYG